MLMNLIKPKDDCKQTGPLFSVANNVETRRHAAWLAARLESSKHLREGELETETVNITPALAEMMLEHNLDNRPIKPAKVKLLATIIREGRWKTTSQGISFSRDGRLNDGQHRLHAIVQSGCAATCRVTFGEDRDVFDVLDTGTGRGGADVLAIAGYKYWNNLAAGTRLYLIVTGNAPLGNQTFPNDIVLRTVEENPLLADVCADAVRVATKLRAPSAPLVAALCLIRDNTAYRAFYESFVDGLAEGANLRQRNPILVLRNMLTTDAFAVRGAGASGRNSRIAAGIILAWNKHVHEKTATDRMLRWSGATEFPMPE